MPFVIHDTTDNDLLFPPDKGRGAVPRDYSVQPEEVFAPPTEIKLIPRSEWSARCRELKERQARGHDLRQRGIGRRVPALDQGQVGYCWSHSLTMANMMARVAMGQPYVPLSAYAVAATIKKGRDEGGWCGLSAQFVRDRGQPDQATWPQGDRDYKKHDKPETWENAARHKTGLDYVDLHRTVHEQNLTEDMIASVLLAGGFVAADYAWWGHSVFLMDWLEVEPGDFGPGGVNSWGEGWGQDGGEFTLQGAKKKTMGAIAILSSAATPA